MTATRLLPHLGHRSRSANNDKGKPRPRVQRSVSMSSSQRNTHSRTRFMPSLFPCAHRMCTRQPRLQASPKVSTGIGT
jgi:hypothetical protein